MNVNELKTPCYVVDESKLIKNLEILQALENETGCHILLAQKAFSFYYAYPLIRKYLSGTTASGLYEARLGYEEMGKENHIFAPAYKDDEIEEIDKICDHIIFNSRNQLERHKDKCQNASIGIRINPEHSTQTDHEIYDPCAKGSRMGITISKLEQWIEETQGIFPEEIEGFHFHTLCEQNSDALEETLQVVIQKFGKYFSNLKWINFGGGHHITKETYDITKLKQCINQIKTTYQLEVFFEPGEAVALNAGSLVTEVLDIVHNGLDIAILDASAACHMPDVLEMPYRPPLQKSFDANEKQFTYRLSSATCLAGDVIGDYSFEHELKCGERLIFEDMAIYSMVKNNTFNGIALPAIYYKKQDEFILVKEFGYSDFKGRLS